MKKTFTAGKSPIPVILKSVAAGLTAAMVLLAVFAYISTKNDIKPTLLPVFLLSADFIGSLIAAWIGTKKTKKRAMIAGLVSGLIFSGVFLLLCYMLSGFSGSIRMLLLIPAAIAGGFIGALVSKRLR